MSTFPAAIEGLTVVQTGATQRGTGVIILRAVKRLALGLLVAVGLSSCSTVRLAYQQAPTLTYWWVDGFVNLREAQGIALEKELASLFLWHQTQELPTYLLRLKHWQTLATQDITPALACTQFETVRSAYVRAVERGLTPMSQLAITLESGQFETLAKKHGKSNKAFEEEWLEGTVLQRDQRRADKLVDRFETLYGTLSTTQRKLVMSQVQQSAFDPSRVLAERLRRQSDLATAIKRAQAEPSQAKLHLQGWHERVMRSPDAAYAQYAQAGIQESCAQLAALHNTTNTEQRDHAVTTLRDYERDLTALARTK